MYITMHSKNLRCNYISMLTLLKKTHLRGATAYFLNNFASAFFLEKYAVAPRRCNLRGAFALHREKIPYMQTFRCYFFTFMKRKACIYGIFSGYISNVPCRLHLQVQYYITIIV